MLRHLVFKMPIITVWVQLLQCVKNKLKLFSLCGVPQTQPSQVKYEKRLHKAQINRIHQHNVTHLLKTEISFSSASSFPFKPCLSIHFIAINLPRLDFSSARTTSEKAPL